MSESKYRVAIVGGGITGLAAALRLSELAPQAEVALFEGSDRLGGILQTTKQDGYLLERSADNFITNIPWGLDLARRVGLADDLLPTQRSSRRALVLRQGKMLPIPDGFAVLLPRSAWRLLTTPLLSTGGKLRMLYERLVPRRANLADESLADFAIRRFGREAYDRLIQPLVGGIYTADPYQLSMQAALPDYVRYEQEHGSLIQAGWSLRRKQPSDDNGARYSLFVAPREGMGSLIQAIARHLPPGMVRLNAPVQSLMALPNGQWQLQQGSAAPEIFDAVIVAIPAPQASQLLCAATPGIAEKLARIPYAGASVVTLGYRRDQLGQLPSEAGCVVPIVENRQMLAVSFSSNKFPGRAPQGEVLLRIFVGGATQPDLARLSDDGLLELARRELTTLLQISGEPRTQAITRWEGKMPQYHVGHLELVASIERETARQHGLFLAGNAYHGVGIPQCIRSGEQAADKVQQAMLSTCVY